MARYVFTYRVDGECKLYVESTPEEDRLDIDEDGFLHIEMTGNGYLAFWKRCKRMIADYLRIAKAYKDNMLTLNDNEYVLGEKHEGTITDLDSGMEKTI